MYNMQDNRIYWQGVGATNRRIIYKAAGYVDDDIKHKPHIGIANTYFDGSPGTGHLRKIRRICKARSMDEWRNANGVWSTSYMWKYCDRFGWFAI